MAKPLKSRTTKRPPPSQPTHTPSKPNSNSQNNNPPSTLFTSPSPALSTLLTTFPSNKIYILSIDTTSPSHRRRTFFLILLFNTLLAALLAYRLWYATPTYLSLFFSILGYKTPTSIASPPTQWTQNARLLAQRMGMFFFDGVVLGRYVSEWPISFFLGPQDDTTGCLGWRYRLGFTWPEREVVVRRSRAWATDISAISSRLLSPNTNNPNQKTNQGADATEKATEIIRAATTPTRIQSKPGLLLIDKDWELYYTGMVDAHALLSDPTSGLTWQELMKNGPIVCIFDATLSSWKIWRPWSDEQKPPQNDGGKLRLFKDLLTAMGREGLFFRWVEVVQHESSSAEAFTSERREQVVKVSKELFEGEGVNWDEVVDGIGGLEGLFGMEVTSQ
ncbi:MAG: hypothetical protein Q9176_007641 [Flavoplaca citrina]